MGYAFISYSTKNQQTADSFKELLNKNNIETWMAPGDIPHGKEYPEAINQAIEGASCFVLLLSEDAQNSKFVKIETRCAVDSDITVIPIKLDDTPLNDTFKFLIGSNQGSVIKKIDDNDKNIQRLLKNISELIGNKIPDPVPVVNRKKIGAIATAASIVIIGGIYAGTQIYENNVSVSETETETKIDVEEKIYTLTTPTTAEGMAFLVEGIRGTYTGSIDEDGLPDGNGKWVSKSGTMSYDGEWYSGQRGDYGTMTWANGDVYNGCWLSDVMTTPGTMTYANGDVYAGYIEYNKKNGVGIYTWADGDVYCGEWNDDERNGVGTMTYADGSTKSGEWKNGKYIAPKIIMSNIPYSGNWGTNITWTLDNTGLLTISGEGKMDDFEFENYETAAWGPYRDNVKEVIINDGITNIGCYAFSECSLLNKITIPSSVIEIGSDAFSKCISLNNIAIPNGVTILEDATFWDCISLSSITIPNSVTRISTIAFFNCISLRYIVIPNSVVEIDDDTFAGCISLRSIVIPNSVVAIGELVFYGCRSLSDITIPSSVMEIGGGVFNGWTSSQTIYIEGRKSAPSGWSSWWNSGCGAKIVWDS